MLCVSGCSVIPTKNSTLNETSPEIFLADYGDFGPPQLSRNLLGNKWWQWDDPDNHKPVRYNVKIVVYRGVDIERVKAAFPVVPNLKQDYRYVEYGAASNYFTEVLAYFEKEAKGHEDPSDLGMMCIFPLSIYKTALSMEKKLSKVSDP